MKKFSKAWLIAIMVGTIWLGGCTQDQQNQLSRLGTNLVAKDYVVTYTENPTVKTWEFHGKVTSEPSKGYYLFYPEGKLVQLPIARTVIEEK